MKVGGQGVQNGATGQGGGILGVQAPILGQGNAVQGGSGLFGTGGSKFFFW